MIDYNRKLSNERETQVPSHRMSTLVQLETLIFRPTLKIFLFPLTRPCCIGTGWSDRKLFYFTSQIRYPLNLVVNNPALSNNIKYTNNLQLRIYFINNTVYIGLFSKFANC